jgi:hypothetical protein
MRPTAHEAVMERVDEQGQVLGFSIIGVSRFQKDGNKEDQGLSPSQDPPPSFPGLMFHKGDRQNIKIPAYCLMTNHLHVVAIPGKEGSLFLGNI